MLFDNDKTPVRVLHVDDDSSILEISKQVLLDLNSKFAIESVHSVDEALKKLSDGIQYDVLISDYDMPLKNGLDFLRELKEKQFTTPFILFTGKGREEVAIKALNMGADGYYNKQGNPETVYGELAHGINLVIDRAKAKLALEESEKRYHALMEQALESIIIHDLTGKIVDVNRQTCKNLQYTKEELLSKNIREISPVAAKNLQVDKIWRDVVSGKPTIFESFHKRKDQSIFPIEVSLNLVVNGNERLVIAIIRDISIKKEAKLLKMQKMFFEEIIDSLPYDVLIIDPDDFKIINANKSLLSQIGADKEDIIGKTCYSITHHNNNPCQPPNDICPVREVLDTGKAISVEHKHFDLFSKLKTVNVWANPIVDPNGKKLIIHISQEQSTKKLS